MRFPDRSAFRRAGNFYLACASEPLALGLRAFERMVRRGVPAPPAEWRRVLLLGAGHIGDVLYNTGSLPALRRGLPNAAVFQVAPALAREAVATNPHLAGVIDPRDVAAQVDSFDAAICYNSGASWRETLAAWRARIPSRAGYADKGFSSLVTHPIPIRRPQPYPAYFRDLVAHLTGQNADWPIRPLVFPDATDEQEASVAWESLSLRQRPVVAAFVTSRQSSGVWPVDKFGEALRALHRRIDCETLLLGSSTDEPVLAALCEQAQLPSRVLAGKLRLPALVALLRRCRAAVTTDSGPRHLANAAGIPVFFVPNLAVGKIETGRYLDTETDLAPDLELISPAEQAAAFARIDPEQVAALVAAAVE